MIVLLYAMSAASLVCWILVLIKVFQSDDTVMGVLSICPLFAFIYGWIKARVLNIQTVMMVWTACVVLNVILQFAFLPRH